MSSENGHKANELPMVKEGILVTMNVSNTLIKTICHNNVG